MPRTAANVAPPAAANPDDEVNRYLRKFKSSLVERWSHTRMKELYEIVDLSVHLWAMDRDDEALAILRSVTGVITEPPRTRDGTVDYNVWCPVVAADALEAWLLRARGDVAARVPSARISDDPGLADNPDFISDQVVSAPAKMAAAAAESSVKRACHRLSRTLIGLLLLAELAAADHRFAGYYDADEVVALIGTGRDLLRTRLDAAA
ncbi:hypothetical protein AB0L57_23865 [Nocardia sp. NPDC052254]|uniref:hypothetical protein n=1 Tax=Nocardia sp. NPDC052254 TaxID=3155681 RepID=UPI003416FB7D